MDDWFLSFIRNFLRSRKKINIYCSISLRRVPKPSTEKKKGI